MFDEEDGSNEVIESVSAVPTEDSPTGEQWADIAGYEGCYQVSDRGKVRSLDRTITAENQVGSYSFPAEGRDLKAKLDRKSGHLRVRLSKGGERQDKILHRLVAEAFVPGKEHGQIVIHLDGDKLNCRANNLERRSNRKQATH